MTCTAVHAHRAFNMEVNNICKFVNIHQVAVSKVMEGERVMASNSCVCVQLCGTYCSIQLKTEPSGAASSTSAHLPDMRTAGPVRMPQTVQARSGDCQGQLGSNIQGLRRGATRRHGKNQK